MLHTLAEREQHEPADPGLEVAGLMEVHQSYFFYS